MMSTEKQKIARARNWNKRMISGATYSLRSMCLCSHMNIGLTKSEKAQINKIFLDLFTLLQTWKKAI